MQPTLTLKYYCSSCRNVSTYVFPGDVCGSQASHCQQPSYSWLSSPGRSCSIYYSYRTIVCFAPSGIPGIFAGGIRNPGKYHPLWIRFRNPSNDWHPIPKFHIQRLNWIRYLKISDSLTWGDMLAVSYRFLIVQLECNVEYRLRWQQLYHHISINQYVLMISSLCFSRNFLDAFRVWSGRRSCQMETQKGRERFYLPPMP